MHTGPIPINDVQSYLQKTREAFVMVDPVERKKKIEEGMIREGARVSGKILKDEELVTDIVTHINYVISTTGMLPFHHCS
jgi:glycyl-tRNA synthetase beta subunit